MTTQIAASVDGSYASRRVLQVMSLTLQAAALILLTLNAPTAIAQLPIFPAWWTIFAVTAIAAPATSSLIVGMWRHPRALQLIAGVQAVGFLAVLWTVPLALGMERMPSGSGMPWPVQISVIAGAAAALRWEFRGAVAYGVTLQATVFALVYVGAGDPVPGPAFGDAVFGIFYVTLFTSLALALRRAGAVLDRTVASAVAEARVSAAAEATRAARRRVASMIHDSVIVALLSYSTRIGDHTTAASEARRALAAIRGVDIVQAAPDRSPVDFTYELQALTTEQDSEATFGWELVGDALVPAAVAEALIEATSEALRNSVRHAAPGDSVSREVHLTITQDLVEVVVLDDGHGFDPPAVAQTRLGIRHGIIGRLESVSGGSAQITSRPGYGTVVALRWIRS